MPFLIRAHNMSGDDREVFAPLRRELEKEKGVKSNFLIIWESGHETTDQDGKEVHGRFVEVVGATSRQRRIIEEYCAKHAIKVFF